MLDITGTAAKGLGGGAFVFPDRQVCFPAQDFTTKVHE